MLTLIDWCFETREPYFMVFHGLPSPSSSTHLPHLVYLLFHFCLCIIWWGSAYCCFYFHWVVNVTYRNYRHWTPRPHTCPLTLSHIVLLLMKGSSLILLTSFNQLWLLSAYEWLVQCKMNLKRTFMCRQLGLSIEKGGGGVIQERGAGRGGGRRRSDG